MFSPVGKKKVLVQIRNAKSSGKYVDAQELIAKMCPRPKSTSPSKRIKEDGEIDMIKKKKTDGPTTDLYKTVASSSFLENMLVNESEAGLAMNKILESTIQYRPEKDADVLKAFQSKEIPYSDFRRFLATIFWLSFTDVEYEEVCKIYDVHKIGSIDGYQFMVSFIQLGSIRKTRETKIVIEKQKKYEDELAAEEERKKLAIIKKNNSAVNYEFTVLDHTNAIEKMTIAAKNYDPSTSPSLDGFTAAWIGPADFREMIKLSFNLTLDRKELGSICKDFDDGNGNVACKKFVQSFFRLGYNERDKDLQNQRKKQAKMDKAAKEMSAHKLRMQEDKMSQAIDFNFNETDEARAMEKLKICSTNYDPKAAGAVSLDGFDCDHLSAGAFKDLVRRVFNLHLSGRELGFIIKKWGKGDTGTLLCSSFLIDFMKWGIEERYRVHLEQLAKQRQMIIDAKEESDKKALENATRKTFQISYEFGEINTETAMSKLTEASVKYDKSRGVSLQSFDPKVLTPQEFDQALIRTFNLKLNPMELGSTVCLYDKDGKGDVFCEGFLNSFFQLGNAERAKRHTEQLERERLARKRDSELHEKILAENSNKMKIDIDYEWTDNDRDSMLEKVTIAATNYDKGGPGAKSLEGFDGKTVPAALFKDMLRNCFNLKLTPRETGCLVKQYDNLVSYEVTSVDFLNYFLMLGFNERSKKHTAQLEKQLIENKLREEDHLRKLKENESRPCKIDYKFTSKHQFSVMDKLLVASTGFDKNHPSSPSLNSFESKSMNPGQMKENLKRTWNIDLSPKELGYLFKHYDKEQIGEINCADFLISFLGMGKKKRDEERKSFLLKKRAIEKESIEKEQKILASQWDHLEKYVDWDFNENDLEDAFDKIKQCSVKFDKSHPASPSLQGFEGGRMTAGVFRDLVRRTFNLWLTPKELCSIVNQFKHKDDKKMIDTKQFLIHFMKIGFEGRNAAKIDFINAEKLSALEKEKEDLKKKRLAAQGSAFSFDYSYGNVDHASAHKKITEASAKYDKNAPGCASLEAFDSKFISPTEFREVLKNVLNIVLTPKELTSLFREYDNGTGNIDCQPFLIGFLRSGTIERTKIHQMQLQKQRYQDKFRKTAHERAMKDAADAYEKNLRISYDFSADEKETAFDKLAAAAKKYDRNHPGSMSLDGFEVKELPIVQFREMLKLTFGVILEPAELGAVVKFFDTKLTGKIPSKKFILHFLKTGISIRAREHSQSLHALRQDAIKREKEEEEKLTGQWAKMQLSLTNDFDEDDKEKSIEKMTEAATKFDPNSPGPMGLTCFEGKTMSTAVFREMLKRSFNLHLNTRELAALCTMFEKDSSGDIISSKFLQQFTAIGMEKRNEARLLQLEKQRKLNKIAKEADEKKRLEVASKSTVPVDYNFSKEEFNVAMEKIRKIASNYDRGHPSSPSLSGFMGPAMTPKEFKDMIQRTFNVSLTPQELGAVVKYFDNDGDGTIDPSEFLSHFYKIQRVAQSHKRTTQIKAIRQVELKHFEEEESHKKKKEREERERLIFTKDDERSFLDKIRKAAQDYATDSSSFVDPLQGYKGPSLGSKAFKELFQRIFMVKLTYSEVGVIMSILDTNNSGVIDGPKFLNWFYKLSRKEESILLGESFKEITFDSLKTGEEKPLLQPFNNNTPNKPKSKIIISKSISNDKLSSKINMKDIKTSSFKSSSFADFDSFDYDVESDDGYKGKMHINDDNFTSATLQESWLIPTAATAAAGDDGTNEHMAGNPSKFINELDAIFAGNFDQSYKFPDDEMSSLGSFDDNSVGVRNMSKTSISSRMKDNKKSTRVSTAPSNKVIKKDNSEIKLFSPIKNKKSQNQKENYEDANQKTLFEMSVKSEVAVPSGVTQRLQDVTRVDRRFKAMDVSEYTHPVQKNKKIRKNSNPYNSMDDDKSLVSKVSDKTGVTGTTGSLSTNNTMHLSQISRNTMKSSKSNLSKSSNKLNKSVKESEIKDFFLPMLFSKNKLQDSKVMSMTSPERSEINDENISLSTESFNI
jgi:hypothetical protein